MSPVHGERVVDGTVGAVIVAAGSGTRMEGLDKLFTQVGSRPLLAHAIAAFEDCWDVDRHRRRAYLKRTSSGAGR